MKCTAPMYTCLEVHKKMRNLGMLVGECTGIVHIVQETHKIILPNSRELKVRPDKIISDDLKNYPEIDLEWSEPGIAFMVTFRKKNYTPEISEKTREKILSTLKATPYITINELAEIVGISSKGVEWQIVKLKKEGRIKRIGPDKGGHWEVIK
jgi:ATP-dependent DNA helicase RecG